MNNVKIQNPVSVKGAYAYQLIDDATGDIVVDVPEQSNLILDGWLNQEKYIPTSLYIVIGAGVVTPPTITDTDMGNQIKSVSSGNPNVTALSHLEGRMFSLAYTVDFTGFSGQEVSEIGIRSGGSTGTLVTRALIKDASGNQTSIMVNAGQTLRLTYSIYLLFPYVVASGTCVTPHGSFDWEYAVTTNSNDSVAGTYWGNYIGGYYGGNSQATFGTDVDGRFTPSISKTVDLPNRKVTCSISVPATSSDRLIGQSSTSAGYGYFLNESYSMFCFKVVGERITLPANYDFSITWEVSWGRLP